MKTRYFLILWVFLLAGNACSSRKEKTSKLVPTKTKKIETKEVAHPGKLIYMQFCLACHMENGEGVPGLYPPLTQTDHVLGDKERLIKTVLHGLDGPMEVKGEKYNNVMAKLDYLRDDQIAQVLTYIRSNFGNKAEAVTTVEVSQVRSLGGR